jgi:hypothetical protein
MAKMLGAIPISGTIGNLTFYQMWGKTYVRKKSSLSRKRVLKSKEFEKTRQCANAFGIASQIGAEIYSELPDDIKHRWFYRAIMGEAATLLYDGQTEEEVREILWKKYIEDTGVQKEPESTNIKGIRTSSKETSSKLREIFSDRWEMQGRAVADFRRAWQKRGRFNPKTFRYYFGLADRPGFKLVAG